MGAFGHCRVLDNIYHTGLFDSFHKAKILALVFLTLSLLGAKAKKGEEFNYRLAIAYAVTGLLLYLSVAYWFIYRPA